MNIKKEFKNYEARLHKDAFEVAAFRDFVKVVCQESGNDYEKEILAKIEKDYTEYLPYLYKKYQEDIAFACENGCETPYEELAQRMDDGIYRYQVFDGYFRRLKELVKQYETQMDVVMDLISAKDRVEAIRVIMLEAEANLKKIC